MASSESPSQEWSGISRSPTTRSVASRTSSASSSPLRRRWPSPKKDWIDSSRRKTERKEVQVFVSNLPQSMTLHKLLNLARKKAGADLKVLSGRLLRNCITMASLGCATLECRNRNEARELVSRLDGIDAMRGHCLSASEVQGTHAVKLSGVSQKTSPEALRRFLEQVGPLASFKNNEIASFRDPVHSLAALIVLDANVLDGTVIRLHRHEEPRRILMREESEPKGAPGDYEDIDANRAECDKTIWQPSLELDWSMHKKAESMKEQSPPRSHDDTALTKRVQQPVSIVRRSVSLRVSDVNTFGKAMPKKQDLLPYALDLGGIHLRLGFWPDARALWGTLQEQQIMPFMTARPESQQLALALCLDDSEMNEVTLTLVAALRPVDAALALTRAPLEATALLRGADGSRLSPYDPFCLQPRKHGKHQRDLVICIFDSRQAAKRPFTSDNQMHVEIVLTLLKMSTGMTNDNISLTEKDALPESILKVQAKKLAMNEPTKLGLSLLQMYESPPEKNGTDLTIVVGNGARLAAHRSVLAARSGFFARQFKHLHLSRTLVLNAERRDIMDTMLCFIYSDVICGNERERILIDAPKLLLDVAHRFDVYGLAEYIEAVAQTRVSHRLDTILHNLRPMQIVPRAPPQFTQSTETLKSIEATAREAALAAAEVDADLAAYFIQAKPEDHDIRNELEARLFSNIDNENLVSLLDLATSLENDKLRDACLIHAKKNLSAVMSDPAFSKLLETRSDLVFELLTALDQHAPQPLDSDDDDSFMDVAVAEGNNTSMYQKHSSPLQDTDEKKHLKSPRLSCLAKATI